jgi:hypothetical protein
LRAATVARLKAAGLALLAIAMAGAALGAGIRGWIGVRDLASDQNSGRAPAVALNAAAESSAGRREADEIVKEIEAALEMTEGLGAGDWCEIQLMPKLSDMNALPTAGKRLIIVAEVNHALYLRMFDVEGTMILDSAAKRFTNTWVEYLQQLVPRLWPPHELTFIDRISVVNAVTQIAGRSGRDEYRRVHGRIASLVGELRAEYPRDPRVAHYLSVRWASLIVIGQRGVVVREIREVLATTKDPELRIGALFYDTSFRMQELIDGRASVSLAESFARQAPGDKRAGELLHMAAHRLAIDWSTLVGLAVTFAIIAGLIAATIGIRRWLKYVVRVSVVLLAVFAVALAGLFFLDNDTLIATIQNAHEKFGDGSALAMVLSRWLPVGSYVQLRILAGTIQAAAAVVLATLCAVFLVVARRRFAEPPTRWPSAIRLGILTFFVVLAASCAADACLLTFQRHAFRERYVGDYPGAFRGK